VLGLPPYWYKDPTFRARAAREPRAVLKEFGFEVPPTVEIKTWDSSAQIRWFVVPERPAGTDGMSEADLAKLVTTLRFAHPTELRHETGRRDVERERGRVRHV
jgi:nitrile hydratase